MQGAVTLGLHAAQAQVYASPARFKALVSGRRFGKTHYARTRLIASALKAPGRYWYVAPTRVMAKDIMWSDLKTAIHPSWLADAPMETELRVSLRGGGEIQLHGAEDPDALRGRPLKGVVFDEYADVKPAAWTEAIRPALSDHKGWADFIGTPKSYNHLHEAYLRGQDAAQPEWASWQFRTVDNPFMDPSEVDAAKRDMDARTFRQEYEASFEAMAGRVYYAFHRAAHVAPVTLEPTWPVCVAFDFNVNPATAVIGQMYHETCRVWREVFVTHAGGEATRASAMGVLALLRQANWRGPIRLYADPAGQGAKTTGPSDHAVIRSLFPGATWCVPSAHPHVRDRVAAVNTRCERADGTRWLTVDPSCTHLIADLEQVIFAPNGDLDKKSNAMLSHVSDALGYWIAQEWPVVPKSAAVATIQAAAPLSGSTAAALIKARRSAQLAKELGIV